MLPPIFKFSDLWNILPFYGYLHKWKLLLEWLSKETQLIWENCEHEFMSKGKEFKSELWVNGENINMNKRWLDWFKLSSDLFGDWLTFRYSEWKSTILNLFKMINEDEAIILELHDLKDKIHKIHIWKSSKLSTFLPAILCPSIKPNTKWFKQSEILKLITYIKKQLNEFTGIFITKRDEIEVNSTINSVYSYEFIKELIKKSKINLKLLKCDLL